jgi:hypothetical protein
MDETTTPGTAKRTHTTFKSAEVLEDIAKVYDIQADKLQASYETARNKAAGYRELAAIGRRMKSDCYPSSKPEGWEVSIVVDKLPKRGSGKTLIDATRDLERVLAATLPPALTEAM